MHDFTKYLSNDEKILYEGVSVPGKSNKAILGPMILISFSLFIIIISIIFNIEVLFLLLIIIIPLLGLGIYGFMYNLLIKAKSIKGNIYCITNKRVFKYNSTNGNLVFGYLSNYEDIHTQNIKDNFGDLYMGILLLENDNSVSIKDFLLNKDKENMPYIIFESIEKPYEVLKIVNEARNNILKEKSK